MRVVNKCVPIILMVFSYEVRTHQISFQENLDIAAFEDWIVAGDGVGCLGTMICNQSAQISPFEPQHAPCTRKSLIPVRVLLV